MNTPKVFEVRVSCMTYNHASFIVEAMRGFVMQETDFPYVVTIVDDASNDGAQDIIASFLADHFVVLSDLIVYDHTKDQAREIVARHKENVNCVFAVYLLKENHYRSKRSKWKYIAKWIKNTKYVAICEGDDYWIEPRKLQIQKDFMDSHSDYSMCFHRITVLTDLEKEKTLFSYLEERDYTAEEVYQRWIVPTCSVMFRRYQGRPFEHHPSIVFSDIFFWLQLAERGKIHCLGMVGAIYRRYTGSASCGYSVETSIKLYNQYKYLEKRFPDLKKISRRKQDEEGLADIVDAPYFPGIWRYRFIYMFRHKKRLLFSKFFVETIVLYTPIRHLLFWKKI